MSNEPLTAEEPDYKKLFHSACAHTFLSLSFLSMALAEGDIKQCLGLMEGLSRELRTLQGYNDA